MKNNSNTVSGNYSYAFGAYVNVDSDNVAAFFKDSTNCRGKLGVNAEDPHSTLHADGSVATAIRNLSEPYTTNSDTLDDDDYTLFVDIDDGDTIFIPNANICGGRIYFFRNKYLNSTFYIKAVGNSIDNTLNISLGPEEGVIIQSDGNTSWWRIANF